MAFTAFLFTFAGDTRGAWTGVQAEIIPMEPDTGNADAGMSLDYDILSTPYFILNDMYLYNKTFDQAMTAFYNELAKSRIKLEKNMN